MLDCCRLPQNLKEVTLREGSVEPNAWIPPSGSSELSPTILRLAPDPRPVPQKGNLQARGGIGFRTTSELEIGLGSPLASPSPEQAGDHNTLCLHGHQTSRHSISFDQLITAKILSD